MAAVFDDTLLRRLLEGASAPTATKHKVLSQLTYFGAAYNLSIPKLAIIFPTKLDHAKSRARSVAASTLLMTPEALKQQSAKWCAHMPPPTCTHPALTMLTTSFAFACERAQRRSAVRG